MYQFTTNTVINTQYAVDYNGNTLTDYNGSSIANFVGSSAGLKVTKVGDFKKANIVSIYKRPYMAGVKEIATIVVSGTTSGDHLRLTVDLKLSQAAQSEYANYSLDFLKPVVVEVIATGTAATDATALVTQLNSLKNRFGHKYFLASNSGTATITLTALEYEQHFNAITLAKVVADTNTITQYSLTTLASGIVGTTGKIGFGDDNWMARQFMLPTAENVRYFGISKTERPVIGGNYSQYTLRYSVAKDYEDGIVGGGSSVTTHVFWVRASLVTLFEAEIAKVGLSIPVTLQASASDGTGTTTLTVKYLNTTLNETDQIVWEGAVGDVTFASDEVLKATVNTSGVVTTAALTGIGDVVITATDSVGNTATIYYNVYTTLAATAANTTGTTPATAMSLDTSDNATNQIAVGTTGAGTITYATNEPTVALVGASTGLVTTNDVTGTGNVTITVTDSAGNVDYVYYTVVA